MPDRSVCESVVRQLWSFLDGAVPEAERERVITHLAECDACKSHFDFATAFLDAVAGAFLPGSELDPLRARVLNALANEGFRLNDDPG